MFPGFGSLMLKKALICRYFGEMLVVRPAEPEKQDASLTSAGFTFSTSERSRVFSGNTLPADVLAQEIPTQ